MASSAAPSEPAVAGTGASDGVDLSQQGQSDPTRTAAQTQPETGSTTTPPDDMAESSGPAMPEASETTGEPPAAGEPESMASEPATMSPDPASEQDSPSVDTTPETNANCGISVESHEVSSEIPTVGIVSWSATATLDEASIEFGPAGGERAMAAPVDLDEPGYLTHLLGMKPESEYEFQIVATSGGQRCTSSVMTLSTGPVANGVPVVSREIINETAISPGFIVTVANGQSAYAYIFDKDGDPVWWAPAPASTSSARLDWDSKYMWMLVGNPNQGGTAGEVRRTSIDGMDVQTVPGTQVAHHDLAPLPDGKVAILIHESTCSGVAEVSPDLTMTETIDLANAYEAGGGCHANSILYHPADQTFTIGDRSHNLYVKVDRADGNLHWQFGGTNPLGPYIEGSWNVNHGHHVLDNGHFLFFNNNGMGSAGGQGMGGSGSPVHEFALDETALTAEQVFSYTSASGEASSSLGDVQRLPNGNTLITYSNRGVIQEIDSAGELVQIITTPDAMGYARHRESLYGAPPK